MNDRRVFLLERTTWRNTKGFSLHSISLMNMESLISRFSLILS